MAGELHNAIITGDRDAARKLTTREMEKGTPPIQIISQHLLPAITEVGNRFECNEFFVPELLIATHALKSALDVIRPLLKETVDLTKGCVVIGAVQGEMHDIGVMLIERILEGIGASVVNLGIDIPASKFVQVVQEKSAAILALSASNLSVKNELKRVLQALEKAGLRQRTKVMVGGPFITQQHADEIGADGYSDNAVGAVNLVRQWLKIDES